MPGSGFLFDSLCGLEGTVSPNDKVFSFKLILDMKVLYISSFHVTFSKVFSVGYPSSNYLLHSALPSCA